MTPENLTDRELDALVATEVDSWENVRWRNLEPWDIDGRKELMGIDPNKRGHGTQCVKYYSTDMNEAMNILPSWPWVMETSENNYKATIGYKGENYSSSNADNMARARCLAALKAVVVE